VAVTARRHVLNSVGVHVGSRSTVPGRRCWVQGDINEKRACSAGIPGRGIGLEEVFLVRLPHRLSRVGVGCGVIVTISYVISTTSPHPEWGHLCGGGRCGLPEGLENRRRRLPCWGLSAPGRTEEQDQQDSRRHRYECTRLMEERL